MARFRPVGLDWMNKGLNDFLKEVDEVTDAMADNRTSIEASSISMKVLDKATGQWVKRTAEVVAGTNAVSTAFTETKHSIKETDEQVGVFQRTVRMSDRQAIQSAGPGGGIGMLTRGFSLLATSIQLYAINALKDLFKWVTKSVLYLATAPLRAVRDLAKLGFEFLINAGRGAIDILQGLATTAVQFTKQIATTLVNLSIKMFDVGQDIESAYAGVAKAGTNIVDSNGQITRTGEIVRKQLLELSKVTPLQITEILGIAELGAQLNVADEALWEFSRVISAVTASTILDANTAALGFGKIATVMGISNDEFDRMGSTIVWLGNNMGIVEDDLILLAQRITGVSKIAGITSDELFGISAAILRLGATPYAGASAFTQFVTKVVPAMRLGTEEGELFAATAGMASDAFIEAWDEDPASTFLNFIAGLSLAGDNAIVILDALGLANIRTSQTFLSLGKSPDLLIEALTGAKTAWHENTALTREAAIRYQTVESRIVMLKNQFDIFSDSLFNTFKPAILAVINVGERLLSVIGALIEDAFAGLEPVVERASGWLNRIADAFKLTVSNIKVLPDDIFDFNTDNIVSQSDKARQTISEAIRSTFMVRYENLRGTVMASRDVSTRAYEEMLDIQTPRIARMYETTRDRIAQALNTSMLLAATQVDPQPAKDIISERFLTLADLRSDRLNSAFSTAEGAIRERFQNYFSLNYVNLTGLADTANDKINGAIEEMFAIRLPPEIEQAGEVEDTLSDRIRRFVGLEDIDLQDETKKVTGNITKAAEGMTEFAIREAERLQARLRIGAKKQAFQEAFEEMFSVDYDRFTGLPPVLQNIALALNDLFGVELGEFLDVSDTFKRIRSGASDLFSSIDWGNLATTMIGWAGTVVDWFTTHWEPDIKPKILAAFNWITTYDWAGLWDKISTSGQAVVDWFVKNWPIIKETVVGAYNDIVDFLFGPKIQDIPGLPPILGMEEEERIGGFVDGLVIGFDEVKLAVEGAANSIRTVIIPALKEAVINIAEMLGLQEGATAKEAGIFVSGKIADTVEAYTKLYEILAKIFAFVSKPEIAPSFGKALLPAPISSFPEMPSGIADFASGDATFAETLRDNMDIDWWDNLGSIIGGGLSSAALAVGTWVTDTIDQFLALDREVVGQSIVPDMMDAIVNVFRTGFAEINSLWSTFWSNLLVGTDTSTSAFLNVMGVESGSSGGLLGTIKDSYQEFYAAGEDIIEAIADGMIAAGHVMVAALKSNITMMNVAVSDGGDAGILRVLDKIGFKITKRIANAIIKSYYLILNALEFALSLGGGLINQARAAANEVRNGAGEATSGVVNNVVNSAGQAQQVAQPTQYYSSPVSSMPLPPTSSSDATVIQVGPNNVRDEMDMNQLENVVRRTVAEEVSR